jgi:hypothetical protein
MESVQGRQSLHRNHSLAGLHERKTLVRVPSSKKFPADFFPRKQLLEDSTDHSSITNSPQSSMEFTFSAVGRLSRSTFIQTVKKMPLVGFSKKTSWTEPTKKPASSNLRLTRKGHC